MDNKIIESSIQLERKWGIRPFIAVANAGYSDEHVQFYHPADLKIEEAMPRYVLYKGTGLEAHPDAVGE